MMIDLKIFSLFDESLLRSGFDASNPILLEKRLKKYNLVLKIVIPFCLLIVFLCLLNSFLLITGVNSVSFTTSAALYFLSISLIIQVINHKMHIDKLKMALFLHQLKTHEKFKDKR